LEPRKRVHRKAAWAKQEAGGRAEAPVEILASLETELGAFSEISVEQNAPTELIGVSS